MTSPYLQKLAVQILLASPAGLSKVRFAKTIYFVHKAMVMAGRSQANDLSFIRMPLGPVPVGFMRLTDEATIIATNRSTGLSYDATEYRLAIHGEPDNDYDLIGRITETLAKFSTYQLVEISHHEPSWLHRRNGQEYTIDAGDLALPIPKAARKHNEALDNQRLQAKLLEGMMPDIVAESTSLEYPD